MLRLRFAVLMSAALLTGCIYGCSGGNAANKSSGDTVNATTGVDGLDGADGGETGASRSSSSNAFLAGGASPPKKKATEAQAEAKPVEPRTSLEGRWDVTLHGIGGNITGLLVDITRAGDGYEVNAVGDSPLGWTLQKSQIDGDNVHFEIGDPEGRTLHLRGTFANGEVRGCLDSGSSGLDLASLLPTSRAELTPENFQEPTGDLERISSLQGDENLLAKLMEMADEAGTGPLRWQLYQRILSMLQRQPQADVPVETVTENVLDAAAPWGERVKNATHVDIAFTLALRGEQPQEVLKHLELAEEGFGDDITDSTRERIALTRGIALVDADETRDQGIELLRSAHDSNPYNLLATSKLAEVYESREQWEDALRMAAEIVAIPTVPGNRQKVAEYWQKLGRDPQDLDAYINEVYEGLIYHFADEGAAAEAASDGQQVLLEELFTGAVCPPCVAADVATGALEKVWSESRFVMLRYHLHVPGPDPMTVSDGERRGDYYRIPGTPSVFFNGQAIQGVGGGIFEAPVVYASLKRLIGPMLDQTSDLSFDLAANADEAGENIHVRATLQGADELPATWRLRLALAEENIHYPAPNGIRLHEMVVRHMPGGASGVAAKDGTLSYEGDVPLAHVLAGIQEGINLAEKRSQGQMPDLPPQVTSLQLVAFIQDDETQQVLQAARIPVNGLAPTTASETEEPSADSSEAGDSPPESDM